MGPQPAPYHTYLSNRAKVRSALERKLVFKSVLENPFKIAWPSVPVNIQNIFLARLVASLENVLPRSHTSQKKTFQTRSSEDIPEEVEFGNIQTNLNPLGPDAHSLSSTSQHLVIGINAVTRALDFQLRLIRKPVIIDSRPRSSDQLPRPAPSIVVVFVCCADVDPTALIDHIPYLIAGCNSPKNVTHLIRLVPLPKGSEPTISQILGVRRAAVVAFRHGSPLIETVQDVLDSIPIVSAPWLCPSDTQDTSQLVPTHIKQLRTTAPKDMKAAKERRLKARAAAKKNMTSSSRAVRRKPRLTLSTGPDNAA